MRTTIILAISALFLAAACKSGPKSEAGKPSETAVEKKTEPTGKLAKWPADYPVTGDSVAIITTKFGEIVLEFFPDVAPNHVRNFKYLANDGFYNRCTFHRVIPNFMIQAGDPNSKDTIRANDGMGGPGWTVDAEFSSKEHNRGILSMARSRDPNSAGSQFFICVKRAQHLDNNYTVFGQVIKGMEAVDSIVGQARDERDNPLERIEMTVRIVPRSAAKL
ncbi:MAG: peptidylprolyl isomerase [Calditrichaeota bacterium]|nr:peptidylprolyl isomerase [Calditrichota bacterium]